MLWVSVALKLHKNTEGELRSDEIIYSSVLRDVFTIPTKSYMKDLPSNSQRLHSPPFNLISPPRNDMNDENIKFFIVNKEVFTFRKHW